MEAETVQHERTPEEHATAVVADLIRLNGYIFSQIRKGRDVRNTPEYEMLQASYYECLFNASEIVPTTNTDYTLPIDYPNKTVITIVGFINRLKEHGFYRVGLVKATLS